ncbi:hypothetical protein Prudu_009721 [Prunus dulcis]|uniref:Uncharacterized protein n=1 Tax=Prunus dulcis TaxID=3755 RepID=A0A4Y1R6W9_PRUDU|nr:hypothetical protein Prudu_009721 [Prunus dulcis]
MTGLFYISFFDIRAFISLHICSVIQAQSSVGRRSAQDPPPGHPSRTTKWKNLGWSKYRGDSAEFSAEV